MSLNGYGCVEVDAEVMPCMGAVVVVVVVAVEEGTIPDRALKVAEHRYTVENMIADYTSTVEHEEESQRLVSAADVHSHEFAAAAVAVVEHTSKVDAHEEEMLKVVYAAEELLLHTDSETPQHHSDVKAARQDENAGALLHQVQHVR